jgi:hypothetical protein
VLPRRRRRQTGKSTLLSNVYPARGSSVAENIKEAHSLTETLKDPTIRDKNTPLAQLGKLFTKADAYNPLTLDTEGLGVQYHIYHSVWNDARELRSGEGLLKPSHNPSPKSEQTKLKGVCIRNTETEGIRPFRWNEARE